MLDVFGTSRSFGILNNSKRGAGRDDDVNLDDQLNRKGNNHVDGKRKLDRRLPHPQNKQQICKTQETVYLPCWHACRLEEVGDAAGLTD